MAAILPTLPELRGLLEVTRLVRDERDLTRFVERITEIVSGALGFGTVAINLFRPAEGDFQVVSVHGNAGAREALLGTTRSPDAWTPLMEERFARRGAYLIPHDEAADWDGVPSYVPDLPIGTDPDAWHPEDALIAPMLSSGGALLGVISVDEPLSGLRPGDDELDLLVAFAQHVAAALESAQASAAAARDRAALTQLLDVSASLLELDSVDAVLSTVSGGIRDALEFEKVAVCLTQPDGTVLPSGTAGWEPGDPALDFSFEAADLDILFVDEFEVEGCYLIGHQTANQLVRNGSQYASVRNGAGPNAWRRHWLLVPLIERDGSRLGFVWVDDPVDCILPSRERLQVLRTFANQATIALRAALDRQSLTARTRELEALHETAVGLLGRLELDRVLRAIVESASRLVDSPDAFLFLAEGDALRMRVGLGRFEPHTGRLLERGRGIVGAAHESGEAVVVDEYRAWESRITDYDDTPYRGAVAVPLRADDRSVAGVIGLARTDALGFRDEQVALLERFAGLASLAFANARLYAALQASEELYRGIVEASRDVICLVDLEGNVEMISAAAERVFGRTREESEGRPFAENVHPDDLEAAMANFAEAMTRPTSLTVRTIHADGRVVLLEATTTPILGPSGEPYRILAAVRDVTERHLLEEQLRHAQKMESIGRLAGGVAHDFNNILTAIRGYAELLLLDLAEDAPARESAEEIARSAARAAGLTGQLLAFSRKQVLRPQRLDLNGVVSGMSQLLGRVLGEDVELTTALAEGVHDVLADPTQLEQVVLNLAVNARDAMPEGGRLLIRTANVDLEAGPHVALVVADTGHGMDAETAARIFEPFFTTKEVGAGTGLGLATVHGIVAQSGGSVEVTSEPGVGTTFTVCLPAV
jgi:PAS domain S-box-containing protein